MSKFKKFVSDLIEVNKHHVPSKRQLGYTLLVSASLSVIMILCAAIFLK